MDTNRGKSTRDELIEMFMEDFKLYNTNWKKIVDINQFPDKFSDEEMQRYKVDKFCDAISALKKLKTSPKSLRAFAKTISYSHTQVANIVNHQIKSIPYDKLEEIASTYFTSVAYLIGLTDDMSYMPNRIDTYFWEKPNSEYKVIEKEIREGLANSERAMRQMVTVAPTPLDDLKNKIITRIGKDYDLASSIYKLVSANKDKRCNFVKILEYLAKL